MPIKSACTVLGSQAELARILRISPAMVNQWAQGKRPVPVEYCAPIDGATKGAVRRWDLRPDDWHLIWPELIGTEGAPALPQPEAKAA